MSQGPGSQVPPSPLPAPDLGGRGGRGRRLGVNAEGSAGMLDGDARRRQDRRAAHDSAGCRANACASCSS